MLSQFLICLFFRVCSEQPIAIDNENSTINIYQNSTESSLNVVDHAECPNLNPELIKEIQSYQATVNKIVSAIVNGQYSGDTWNA